MMVDQDQRRARQGERLIQLLAGIKLPEKYYGYVDAHAGREPSRAPPRPEQIAPLLAETGLGFHYNKRERFFGYRQPLGSCQIGLHVAVMAWELEFILVFQTAAGHLGGPLSGLAWDAAQLGDPDFAREPAYPNLPFRDEASLKETLAFGLDLYRQIKAAVAAQSWEES